MFNGIANMNFSKQNVPRFEWDMPLDAHCAISSSWNLFPNCSGLQNGLSAEAGRAEPGRAGPSMADMTIQLMVLTVAKAIE